MTTALGGPATAAEILVTGVCQGVGFRPFVHRLATRHGLTGWVRNEAGAVRIVCEGQASDLEMFTHLLESDAPPLARIDRVRSTPRAPMGLADFRIAPSPDFSPGRLPVSPDVAVCSACQEETADPSNRRYRYPFTTCTDCGPRFTVIEALPYDRERSTMRVFEQCDECLAEYRDPTNRRYHSETNSCPACGPRVWFEDPPGKLVSKSEDAIRDAAVRLQTGEVLALRGLGGFHLAVDATNEDAVQRLRLAKSREAKPLAVMVRSLEEAGRLGVVRRPEATALTSPEKAIVLLEPRPESPLARGIAPGMGRVGVMLAYTPLHLLLLEKVGGPLVMTSGNLSDEPIATSNDEARRRLVSIADGFLLHDREIAARYDDSVVMFAADRRIVLRRARGYAPLPLDLPIPAGRPLLAVGAHLKNTFTLASGSDAFVSQHIGDLENLETVEHFTESLERYRELFRIEPEVVVCDMHPGYLSSTLAENMDLGDPIRVQHHHAHVAAIAAEHGVTDSVLGLAFDGTGYGDDGHAWGFEFLEADLLGYRRLAHLRYAPLPGGDLAVRTPWRTALGYASLDPDAAGAFGAAFEGVPAAEVEIARRQIERRLNAPLASSLGRLFDAAAAVLGVRRASQFEGQAPMELEAIASSASADPLPFPVAQTRDGLLILDPLPLLAALGDGLARGVDVPTLAARFHASVVASSADVTVRLARTCGLDTVVLSGGCMLNARLVSAMSQRLHEHGLRVLLAERLGPNDGAISYGQAAIAAARLTQT